MNDHDVERALEIEQEIRVMSPVSTLRFIGPQTAASEILVYAPDGTFKGELASIGVTPIRAIHFQELRDLLR